MSPTAKSARGVVLGILEVLASLRLTIALLVLSIVMIFAATLDQVDLGIWGVQEKYFHSFFIWLPLPGLDFALPVFPGGYTLGPLLLANLLAAHLFRFKFSVRKSGIWLTHAGLILLLIGEGLSGLMQHDGQMRIDVGQAQNFVESSREFELSLVDVTDPAVDKVFAFSTEALRAGRLVSAPGLPVKVQGLAYFPNASIRLRNGSLDSAPIFPAVGAGADVVVQPLLPATKDGDMNWPAVYVRLSTEHGTLGIWLVSAMMNAPQTVEVDGRRLELSVRLRRDYLPFALTLVRFTHDIYPGTTIPKNFASLVRLRSPDGAVNRMVKISMNSPLRFAGLAFYQAGFSNNDRTSVLQVVRNPSWTLPYVSCALIALGLCIQFGLGLIGFLGRMRPAKSRVRGETARTDVAFGVEP